MRPRVVLLLERWLGGHAGDVVPGYMAMLAIACLVGTIVVVDETSRVGYARSTALRAMMAAYVVGLLGAGAVPVLQGVLRWVSTGSSSGGAGLAAYGGILGGLAATAVTLRRAGKPVLPFLDAGIPAIGLGYFLARIGCFLAGCDYGRPTALPVAVSFPRDSHAWRDHVARGWISPDAALSAPVHPTQLYMALIGLCLYFTCKGIPARGDGTRFAAFMSGYAALRFGVEFLRGDASRGLIGWLSTSQLIAIAVLAALAAWRLRARARSV